METLMTFQSLVSPLPDGSLCLHSLLTVSIHEITYSPNLSYGLEAIIPSKENIVGLCIHSLIIPVLLHLMPNIAF